MKDLWQFLSSTPPDPAMGVTLWVGFRQEIIGWLLASVLVTAAVVIGLYAWSSRKLTIRVPSDPFRPFTPLRWLWLAFVPGVLLTIVYILRYSRIFPLARISAVGGAVTAGLTAVLFTYLISQIAIWMPGITPLKFLYHPRWPWRLFSGRAA